jgi:hypothetical protein
MESITLPFGGDGVFTQWEANVCSSMCLLTAMLMGGGQVPVSSNTMVVPVPQQVVYPSAAVPPRRGLLNRLSDMLHHSPEGDSYSGGCTDTVMYTSSPASAQPMPQEERIVAMPDTNGPVLTSPEPPIAPVSAPVALGSAPIAPVVAREMKADVKKAFQSKVGHADDYSWITGQLFYVHADGGVWVLRYASVGEEDRYGGSAVLATAVNMKNYREGDLVSVSGEVLDQGRASRHLGGCLFRASSIDMIERAD